MPDRARTRGCRRYRVGLALGLAVAAVLWAPSARAVAQDEPRAESAPEPSGDAVEREADLSVTLTALVDPIVAGSLQIYAIAVTNLGPDPATGVDLQHELPPGSILVGAEPVTAGCEALSDLWLGCAVGSLEAGATARIEVAALVDPRVDGLYVSDVAVAAEQPDPDGANDEARVETRVVAARQMVATTHGETPALALTLGEGETSVSLAFLDPSGAGERQYRVEATGHRSVALAEVGHFGGSEAPEVASLAAGFEGGTRVVAVDAGSREPLGDHAVVGDGLGLGIASVGSFAGSPAAELAVLLWDPATHEPRLELVDAATGAALRAHALPSRNVPVALAPMPDSLPGALAVLGRSPDGGGTTVWVVEPESGITRTLELGSGLWPLGLVALSDLGLAEGTPEGELAALVRRAGSGELAVLLVDSGNGAHVGTVEFGMAQAAAPLIPVPMQNPGSQLRLGLLTRIDSATLELTVKEAGTGAGVRSIRIASPGAIPVPLAAAWWAGEGSRPSPAVLWEPFGAASRVELYPPDESAPRVSVTLP